MAVSRQEAARMYYSVDALENGTARLVDDAGRQGVRAACGRPAARCGGRGCLEHRDGVWSAAPGGKRSGAKRAALRF